MDLPEVATPDELAKRMGWSARRVRNLARKLGACRILGNRMVLVKEDVDAILEATRPRPAPHPRSTELCPPRPRLPDITAEELVRMLENKALTRRRR